MKKLSLSLTTLLLLVFSNLYAQTECNEEILYKEIHCVQIYWKYCPQSANNPATVVYRFVNSANSNRNISFTTTWTIGSVSYSVSGSQMVDANSKIWNLVQLESKYSKMKNSAKVEVTKVENGDITNLTVIDDCNSAKSNGNITSNESGNIKANYYIVKTDSILGLKDSECEKLKKIEQLSSENREDKNRNNKEIDEGSQYISKVFGEQQKKCDNEKSALGTSDIDGIYEVSPANQNFIIIKWTCSDKKQENMLNDTPTPKMENSTFYEFKTTNNVATVKIFSDAPESKPWTGVLKKISEVNYISELDTNYNTDHIKGSMNFTFDKNNLSYESEATGEMSSLKCSFYSKETGTGIKK